MKTIFQIQVREEGNTRIVPVVLRREVGYQFPIHKQEAVSISGLLVRVEDVIHVVERQFRVVCLAPIEALPGELHKKVAELMMADFYKM